MGNTTPSATTESLAYSASPEAAADTLATDLLARHSTPPLRPFLPPAVGDTIPINYNNKRYFIDIIEAKPGDAISVIETDCNVSNGAGWEETCSQFEKIHASWPVCLGEAAEEPTAT